MLLYGLLHATSQAWRMPAAWLQLPASASTAEGCRPDTPPAAVLNSTAALCARNALASPPSPCPAARRRLLRHPAVSDARFKSCLERMLGSAQKLSGLLHGQAVRVAEVNGLSPDRAVIDIAWNWQP